MKLLNPCRIGKPAVAGGVSLMGQGVFPENELRVVPMEGSTPISHTLDFTPSMVSFIPSTSSSS